MQLRRALQAGAQGVLPVLTTGGEEATGSGIPEGPDGAAGASRRENVSVVIGVDRAKLKIVARETHAYGRGGNLRPFISVALGHLREWLPYFFAGLTHLRLSSSRYVPPWKGLLRCAYTYIFYSLF